MTIQSRSGADLAKESARRGLYAALLAAVLLRLAWAALVPVIPVSDSLAYDTFANNLAAGDGFGWKRGEPSAFFAPGAAFVYAAIYYMVGHSYTPIVALHILVSAATIALVWKLTGEWFGPRAATSSAWLLAVWPSQIMFVTVLATELLFNVLLVMALWIWTRESLRIWTRGLLTGPVFALAALVRPHALLLPVLFALGGVLGQRQRVGAIGLAAIAGVVMMSLILPWSVRNERVFGERVLIAANFGANLWMGNNPQSSGEYMPIPDDVRRLDSVQRDKELRRRAVEYILAEPVRFVKLSAARLVTTHARETINVAWNIEGIKRTFGEKVLTPFKALGSAYWYVVLLAAVAGAVLLLRRDGILRTAFHPTVLLWTYFAVVHAVIVAQDRYHFIAIPLIAALAGFAISPLSIRLERATNLMRKAGR